MEYFTAMRNCLGFCVAHPGMFVSAPSPKNLHMEICKFWRCPQDPANASLELCKFGACGLQMIDLWAMRCEGKLPIWPFPSPSHVHVYIYIYIETYVYTHRWVLKTTGFGSDHLPLLFPWGDLIAGLHRGHLAAAPV